MLMLFDWSIVRQTIHGNYAFRDQQDYIFAVLEIRLGFKSLRWQDILSGTEKQ